MPLPKARGLRVARIAGRGIVAAVGGGGGAGNAGYSCPQSLTSTPQAGAAPATAGREAAASSRGSSGERRAAAEAASYRRHLPRWCGRHEDGGDRRGRQWRRVDRECSNETAACMGMGVGFGSPPTTPTTAFRVAACPPCRRAPRQTSEEVVNSAGAVVARPLSRRGGGGGNSGIGTAAATRAATVSKRTGLLVIEFPEQRASSW